MKIVKRNHAFVALLAVLAGSAHAHAGHGAFNFFEGVSHPFLGWDHVLSMIAVGMWSVLSFPARQVAIGPMTFLLLMVVGALVGMAGGGVVDLERLMTLGVVLLALMLFVPLLSRSHVAKGLGLCVVAAAALLHGLAHGLEAPAGQAFAYVLGFVVATALLHGLGAFAAVCARRAWSAPAASLALGTTVGGAGVYLLGQFI